MNPDIEWLADPPMIEGHVSAPRVFPSVPPSVRDLRHEVCALRGLVERLEETVAALTKAHDTLTRKVARIETSKAREEMARLLALARAENRDTRDVLVAVKRDAEKAQASAFQAEMAARRAKGTP